MSTIKSFSVGNGDMFYINHNSDNFTLIDCCLLCDIKDDILSEITPLWKSKGIARFISTHPDDDHICGIEYLDEKLSILNFYCVKNNATKLEPTDDFKHYCSLRDGNHAYYIYDDCKRKWMNQSDEERGSAGISILWPKTNNEYYKEALQIAADSGCPNNVSPIIKYSLENGIDALWFGDLENSFMEKIKDEITFPEATIIFAPHHGRKSGKIPNTWLDQISPQIIVVGEAASCDLCYYTNYNTITQNSSGDITFVCNDNIDIYVSNENYSVDFLTDYDKSNMYDYYIGTLDL